MRIPNNRKGFKVKESQPPPVYIENINYLKGTPVVYGESKLSHSGITSYKVFDGYTRKIHANSLKNLINQVQAMYDGKPAEILKKEERCLNKVQSRKVKRIANKLAYYSRIRTFTSKKTGSYKFKVGFITLTNPGNASDIQLLHAFEHFLDYLRRTALCHYVWKKERGEKGHALHFHIMVNNFIPYYIIAWKWKRLLLNEGVKWSKNEKGNDTDSHTRIELPRSRRLVAHYIAKYMSKAYSIERGLGYLTGYSEILDELKDQKFLEGELDSEEILILQKCFRTIKDVFLSHVFCDLRRVQDIAPTIFYWFDRQFREFQDKITLEQKYYYV
jgi:hypothetical protein